MIKKTKENNGITIIALVITVIVMIIIAGISINEGTKIIRQAKIQTLETDMLAMKAKAKAYAEEIDAGIWAISDVSKKETQKATLYGNYGMTLVNVNTLSSEIQSQLNSAIDKNNCEVYKITATTLEKMGLDEISEDSDSYYIVYNAENFNESDIVYVDGFKDGNDIYYTLSSMQAMND